MDYNARARTIREGNELVFYDAARNRLGSYTIGREDNTFDALHGKIVDAYRAGTLTRGKFEQFTRILVRAGYELPATNRVQEAEREAKLSHWTAHILAIPSRAIREIIPIHGTIEFKIAESEGFDRRAA